MDLKSIKNECTLADIAENEDKRDKKLTFGVIIDVSEPFRYEDKKEFVTKLKVIDPSFNFMAYVDNKDIKFHKYVTVNIYSEFLSKCPKIKNVGDIIRLRRFNFQLNDHGELTGFLNTYSNWLIYQGSKGAPMKPSSFQEIDKNIDREITPFERNRIEELRDWSHSFFQNHRLKFITWWTPVKEPVDEEKAFKEHYQATECDLILRTEKVIKDKKAVEFVDHANKKYGLFLQVAPVLAKNDVIKLRCVNIIFSEEGRLIQLTKNSSCLIIPDHFFDAMLFNKSAKVSPGPLSLRTPDKRGARASKIGTPLPTKREASNLFPFLLDYEYERYLIENPELNKNLEKKEYTLLKKNFVHKMPMPMKDLLEILDAPSAYEHYKFVVCGKIKKFSSTSVSTIVKKMNEQTRKVYEFNEKGPEKATSLKHIYHFMITMTDSSLEHTNKSLSIYVLTNEGDQHLFDLWEILPRPEDYEGWMQVPKQLINQFEKKLDGLTQLSVNVKFAIQLLITENGKPFFKLYDTVFLP